MKVLLFGGSSELGTEIKKVFPDVIAPTKEEFDFLSLTNYKVKKYLSSVDIVINAAEITDDSKPIEMFHINTAVPTYIADKVGRSRKKRFIQISTPYIFDGIGGSGKQPYPEILAMYPQFRFNPRYAYTKWLAENNILLVGKLGRSFVLRLSYLPNESVLSAPTNELSSSVYADEAASLISSFVSNIDKFGEHSIVNVGRKNPDSFFNIAKQRNEDVEPFGFDTDCDFSLDTSVFYKHI